MSIISRIGAVYRATELDAFRPSSAVTPQQAKTWTTNNNLANAAMYTANAIFFPTGIINAVVGVAKLMVGMFAAATSLGETGERQAARMAYAGTLYKSGFENMLVGAAACIPGGGTYIAGAMAVRSLADAVSVDSTLKALPAPKAD